MHCKAFEREVVSFYADIFNAPANNHWGYVTNGGSEGNLYGLYLARELYPNGIVYYSEATHYSVQKNLHLLNMNSIVIRSQPNGEMAFQAELTYNIKKGTKLGGKYGTDVVINLSNAYSIQKTPAANDTFGYNSKFFAVGNTPYFHDYHIEIRRKINSKWKATAMYLNWLYNKDVVQGLSGYGTIYANMFVLDAAYKIKSNHTIRAEVQGLFSKQDEGSWAMAMIEYTFAPHWYIAVMDQYNYGNPSESRQIHYVNFNAGYIKDGNRIMLGYGRQRAGIFCVGGVCRNVPASNGLSITIMSSF
jgi:hypothetical protein